MTDTLLTDLAKSSEMCKGLNRIFTILSIVLYLDALLMEVREFVFHCDAVQKQISSHTEELIDSIKQQEKQLNADLSKILAQQLE